MILPEFTHIDKEGHVKMVDITDKDQSLRVALAQGIVSMNQETFEKIHDHSVKKGNVLETARIAGIMAAKKTSELIPMCHPLLLSHISIKFYPDQASSSIRIEALVRLTGRTGVEMEALTAVSIAALTIYDMCKSYDRRMTIFDILLVEKSGGKSGTFTRD